MPRQDFDKFARLVLETGLAEMQSRGTSSVLARTCLDPQYKAFYLRGRQPGEEEAFYGESIYRNQIID